MTRSLPLVLLSFSLAPLGCDLGPAEPEDEAMAIGEDDDDGDDDDDDDDDGAAEAENGETLAEIAADAGDAVSGESALVASVSIAAAEAAASGQVQADEELAMAAASETSLTTLCSYGGTVTATWDGSAVTYEFVACSTHCGMHRATGEVVVDYHLVENGVAVDVFAENFRIDGTTSDLDLSAEYRVDGTVASMSIDTEAAIKGWFGWEITRSGNYDASFDSATQCISHDGQWRTTFGEHAYSTTLSNYERCALECPQQGSRLTFEAETSGYTFEAEFSSPTTLEWSTSNGVMGSLEIPACG